MNFDKYYWQGFDAGYSDNRDYKDKQVCKSAPFGCVLQEDIDAFVDGYYAGWAACDEFFDSEASQYDDPDFFEDDFFEDDYDDYEDGDFFDDEDDFFAPGSDYSQGYEDGTYDALANEQAAYFQGAADALAFVCLVIEAMLDG